MEAAWEESPQHVVLRAFCVHGPAKVRLAPAGSQAGTSRVAGWHQLGRQAARLPLRAWRHRSPGSWGQGQGAFVGGAAGNMDLNNILTGFVQTGLHERPGLHADGG